ncbi:MAG: sigma-70 family RNA polymerase sigma factor [Phycisphaeraceae bacterium]|nr:sigma-70 family RNA polymerase sigma factor [Phycisphaeraceae bacterium]
MNPNWPVISVTTTALLEALRNPAADAAWTAFDARYRPILEGFGRRLGFSDLDAAELAQEVLVRFTEAYREGRYDRDRGRLRAWLIGIARIVAQDRRRRAARHAGDRGDSAMGGLPDEGDLERIWYEESEKKLLADSIEELRRSSRAEPRTVRAFELVALRGMPPAEVAVECGLSSAEVYRVKHRMTERLRSIVERLRALEDDEPESEHLLT